MLAYPLPIVNIESIQQSKIEDRTGTANSKLFVGGGLLCPMVRLITLKLQAVSRPVNHPPLPPPPNQPPPIPAKSPRRPESKMPSTLLLPQTQNQWRIVLDEVRATYLRRQYKQCSVHCIQLLEAAPNMVRQYRFIFHFKSGN
jgi:hypothetical protein